MAENLLLSRGASIALPWTRKGRSFSFYPGHKLLLTAEVNDVDYPFTVSLFLFFILFLMCMSASNQGAQRFPTCNF